MECALDARLVALRDAAKAGRDPTAADETLHALIAWAKTHNATKILEIGAAEGLTSCALLLCTGACVTAIERDAKRASAARHNFALFGVEERAQLIEGDAGEILPLLNGEYDLIFLDGPKVQYRRYLPDCKRLLRRGGALFSDDVLLFGWVQGEAPKKREMLAKHLREYNELIANDSELTTQFYDYGEGLAISIKQ